MFSFVQITDYTILDKLFELCSFMQTVIPRPFMQTVIYHMKITLTAFS